MLCHSLWRILYKMRLFLPSRSIKNTYVKVKVVIAFFVCLFPIYKHHFPWLPTMWKMILLEPLMVRWVPSFDQWRWEEVTCDPHVGKHLISDAQVLRQLFLRNCGSSSLCAENIWWKLPEYRANRWEQLSWRFTWNRCRLGLNETLW